MRSPWRGWVIGVVATALTLLATLALPRVGAVERTADIAARPATVYELLSDLTAVRRWTPWRDARSHYLFSGPRMGVGAHMEWSGQSRGRTTIEQADPYRRVAYRFELAGDPRYAEVRLAPTAQGVRATWRVQRDAGYNPLLRVANLWFAWRQAPELDRGLDRLGDTAEALPKADMAAAHVRLVQRPARPFAYVAGQTAADPAAIAAALTRGLQQVDRSLKGAGAASPGALAWGAPTWIAEPPDAQGQLAYRIGRTLPAPAVKPLGRGVQVGELAGGPVIEARHRGPIEQAEQVRAAARLYRGIHQLAPSGPARLEFLSDPEAADVDARFEFPVNTPGS